MPFQQSGFDWYDDEIRCIFEALPDMIFVVTEDGTCIKFHSNRPENLPAPPEQIIGKKAADFLPPGVAQRFLKLLPAAIASGQQQSMAYRHATLSNESRDFEARIIPCDRDKVLVLVRDMTDYMEAERGRLEAEREATDLRRKLSDGGA
ncbi:MAG: PAS domain-containing protein [Elusimicrobia bacterium]|nr:PAS domain-containing protein [Elusimicrobiota bacterium]